MSPLSPGFASTRQSISPSSLQAAHSGTPSLVNAGALPGVAGTIQQGIAGTATQSAQNHQALLQAVSDIQIAELLASFAGAPAPAQEAWQANAHSRQLPAACSSIQAPKRRLVTQHEVLKVLHAANGELVPYAQLGAATRPQVRALYKKIKSLQEENWPIVHQPDIGFQLLVNVSTAHPAPSGSSLPNTCAPPHAVVMHLPHNAMTDSGEFDATSAMVRQPAFRSASEVLARMRASGRAEATLAELGVASLEDMLTLAEQIELLRPAWTVTFQRNPDRYSLTGAPQPTLTPPANAGTSDAIRKGEKRATRPDANAANAPQPRPPTVRRMVPPGMTVVLFQDGQVHVLPSGKLNTLELDRKYGPRFCAIPDELLRRDPALYIRLHQTGGLDHEARQSLDAFLAAHQIVPSLNTDAATKAALAAYRAAHQTSSSQIRRASALLGNRSTTVT